MRDGKTTIWWPNGEPHKRFTYEKEILEGKYEEWRANGNPYLRFTYEKGIFDGEYEEWWPSGKLYMRFNYEKGILDGKYEEWDSLGADIVKGYYVQGTRDKKWLYYDSEGRRDKFIFLEMDSLITDYEFKYYPNWQIVEEPGFNDRGLFDGKWESFYIDGATSKKYQYDEGKKDKVWQSYYQDGRRDNYTFYDQDSLVTNYDFNYYSNLQIMEEPRFSKDGLFDGKWEAYYEDGQIKKTFGYDQNKKDKIWFSYFNDQRRQNYTYYNQDTLVTDYDFTGTVRETIDILENKSIDLGAILINPSDLGLHNMILNNGNIIFYDFEYYMNLKVVEKPRNDNLQIVEEPKFSKQGLFDGKWESFYENGDTWRTFYYNEGNKIKLWSVFYDSTGTRQSETNYENDLKEVELYLCSTSPEATPLFLATSSKVLTSL